MSYYYVANGKVADYPVKESASVDEVKKQTLKDIKEIDKTKEFKAKPTVLCRYCDFDDVCPYARK